MDELLDDTPLRVLMTTDTVGGVWSYSLELCKALQPYGVEFCLVTTGAPLSNAQKKEAAALPHVLVHETNFLLEWMDNPWQSIDASGPWLLQLEKAWQPHLIHLNGYAYGALPWKAPVLMVAHSDVFSWWQAVHKEDPPPAWSEYYHRVKKGLQGAHLLVAPSAALLQAVQEIYAPTTPAKVIYNGRDAHSFYTAPKEPFVFSMGRIWDEAKNVQLLTEAAPLLSYPIRLAGDTSFEGNHCATNQENVCYLGRLSTTAVAEQLSKAALYVLPAKYEPFGLSALEAALSGCALVLGRIDSLQEIWKDSALYIDTDDAPALAETINYLMQNEAVRRQYAQKARQRAALYTTKTMAVQYLQAYRQLVQTKKQKRQPQTI